MSGPDEYPGVRQKLEEQAELMRIAAVSALERSRGGKDLDRHARDWALHCVRGAARARMTNWLH